MFSFPPVPAVSPCFIHGHSHLLCHWATALSLTRAAKRLFPSAGSLFLYGPPLLRDPRAFRLRTTADIRTDPFQHNITSIDRHTGCRIWQVVFKTCGNLCFILHIGSRGCQRHGWTLNPNVLTCFKQEVCLLRWWWQRHAPKSRLLNFKGTLKTGTWDDKSREIPCPSCPTKLKEPEISNFKSSKHATLNCNYLLWLPVKNCFQNGCDIGWGPQPLSSLTSTEAFAASSCSALPRWPLSAA